MTKTNGRKHDEPTAVTLGEAKFYGSVTVGERGQIALPIELRRALGIEPGAKLLILQIEGKPVIYVVKSDLLQTVVAKLAADGALPGVDA